MTLDEAVAKLQSKFKTITVDEKQQGNKDLPVCWSGGIRSWEQNSAALYATKDMAIQMWLDTAQSLEAGNTLHWVLKPELLEFQVTIADRLGRHRAVDNRFAVKSQFETK